MSLITVPLRDEEKQALIRLAGQERRHPREQAAFLLRRELERRGLLEPERPEAREAQEARHAQ